MTNNLSEVEGSEVDSSLYSSESNLSDEFFIRDSVISEEERLISENEKLVIEEEERVTIEKENFATEEEELLFLEELKENLENEEDYLKHREAEIKEKRYKRLMHLLKSSKMYAVLLKDKLQEIADRKNSNQNSEESTSKKRKSPTDYNIGEVITEKEIEDNLREEPKIVEDDNSEDFFKETRVTDLGFTVSYKQPVLLEGAAMRDYQLKGLDWMINLFLNGINGILADEMGLGKTIQVISFICYLIELNIGGPFLIVAPLSTISNWMAEFKRFAPKVPTLLYHGSKAEREMLLPKIFKKAKVGKKFSKKVVITSFQIPLKDKDILGKINWYYLIIDEGHRIKNHHSILSRTLRQYNTIGRVLLTGTPLQNNLSELWSLLNFLIPEVFSTLDVFESWFDIKELEKNGTNFIQKKLNLDIVNTLQEILVPFLLRREKKDVDLQLPPKKEILIYCPMTQLQKELYQATLDRSIESLLKPKEDILNHLEPLPKRRCFIHSPYGTPHSEKSKHIKTETPVKDLDRYLTKIVLSNPQMQLRKIVNHPYLIQHPLKTGTEELRIDEDIVKQSGKLLVLDAMLSKMKNRGHKVIIFSNFKVVLDILEDYAIMRDYQYCRLDGDTKIGDRDEEIKKFVSDPNIFIFFISMRAGGLGINLTAADTVIFYDSDWNPQVNLQSQDRCHRIGQTKPVVVYRLCANGTIDERIIERGNAKRRLEKMILQKGKFTFDLKSSKNNNLLDLQELKKLLESTDHDAVINSNGFVLTDEELEALLDRSNMTSDSLPPEENDNKVFKVLNYEK